MKHFLMVLGHLQIFYWDFPGCPVVKTLHFQCREHGFNPWSGKKDPTCRMVQPKKIFFLFLNFVLLYFILMCIRENITNLSKYDLQIFCLGRS